MIIFMQKNALDRNIIPFIIKIRIKVNFVSKIEIIYEKLLANIPNGERLRVFLLIPGIQQHLLPQLLIKIVLEVLVWKIEQTK